MKKVCFSLQPWIKDRRHVVLTCPSICPFVRNINIGHNFVIIEYMQVSFIFRTQYLFLQDFQSTLLDLTMTPITQYLNKRKQLMQFVCQNFNLFSNRRLIYYIDFNIKHCEQSNVLSLTALVLSFFIGHHFHLAKMSLPIFFPGDNNTLDRQWLLDSLSLFECKDIDEYMNCDLR